MSLGVNLLRRSAMRNALALSGLFIAVLALCGLWMVVQIRSDVRDEIDTQLKLAHSDMQAQDVTTDDIRAWFTDEDDLILYTEAYRTAAGEVLGTLRPEVFDTLGFQTLSFHSLFQGRYFNSFEWAHGRDRAFLDEEPLPDEVDTWRVYVAHLDGGRMAVFEPLSAVEDALGIVPQVVITVGAALVATTLLAGTIMAWRQQIRLDRIRDGIARIGRGDLSQPMAPELVRDDLDEIMLGIDRAAAELNGSISQLKLFSQNVAHELRTPLARLRAVLEDSPALPSAALERTDEVIRTLDAVQRIARLSHQPAPGTLSPVPLADVATLAEDLFAEVALENGQKLRVVLDAPAVVQGDFQLLVQMVSNLVENAIRYSGNGARITISAQNHCLSVSDTGPGITTSDDMTEPFARAAESRAHDGSGLGLALVKAIARYHGAKLSLHSDHGLRAQVSFSDLSGESDPLH